MNDEQSGGHAVSAEALGKTSMAGGAGNALGSDIQAKIGQHLRAMYDDVVRQGVPDRFLDLLSQLDEPAKATKSGEGGGEK
ncbi:NepR family anti-sigma factor [Ancylobacter sp. SL191]|uniref:NepR family anti-sigma factor n=1 Tax=Ancylobacter sp. SL191 TaxID=2995166 RepID=UPI003B640562